MYRFDLDNFMELFKETIKSESKNSFTGIDDKLRKYVESLIRISFTYYSRSLFKSDLLVFGLYYVKTIFDDGTDEYNQKWNFLLGNLDTSGTNSRTPSWLPEERKIFYNTLDKYFSNLARIISDNESWFKSDKPEEEFSSLINARNISELDKVLLIQTIRHDRMENALKNVLITQMMTTVIIYVKTLN